MWFLHFTLFYVLVSSPDGYWTFKQKLGPFDSYEICMKAGENELNEIKKYKNPVSKNFGIREMFIKGGRYFCGGKDDE